MFRFVWNEVALFSCNFFLFGYYTYHCFVVIDARSLSLSRAKRTHLYVLRLCSLSENGLVLVIASCQYPVLSTSFRDYFLHMLSACTLRIRAHATDYFISSSQL